MGQVPDTLIAYAALAFGEGMLKYGQVNWRAAGVRTSIYMDAMQRHLAKFRNGEWEDDVTHVPHLSSILACAGIIIDAYESGTLTDDRPMAAPLGATITKLEKVWVHLKTIFADKSPKHWTIQDEKPK